MIKKIELLIRIIIIIFVWITGCYILYRYEYFIAFNEIDNIVGMIPVALVLTAAIGINVLLWIIHKKQFFAVSAVIFLFVILSIVLFPLALRGNWWINPTTFNESEAAPDLTIFIPFSENSKTAKLDEKSQLLLTDSLPVLDGATALYPVYAAFAEAVYDKNIFSQDYVLCTSTRNAYQGIISGNRDIIFTVGASEQQVAAAKEAGVDLYFTPIGREAFVFLTGKNNPVDNLTYQQIRNIYSGKTAKWSTLGWREGGSIIAFQRPQGSGSQTGLQTYLKGLPIQVPQPLPDASLIGTNSLMRQVSLEWQGVQPALGYSYRYFALTMYSNPDVKLLKIDGIEPSIVNIQNGSYRFIGNFYAVTNGQSQGNSKLLIDWILSPQGQEIIEKTGYIPL
ncbi:MAG: substrate-binding domain-containing protein [Treponema sp.]|nr:substrate-binding domain-containing protein [Treponema sp.]